MNSVPRRPDEVPVDVLEPSIERLVTEAFEVTHAIRRGLPDSEVVRHALAAIAYSRVITDQLMRARWPFIAEALSHGATVAQVATGAGLSPDELRDGLCAFGSTGLAAGDGCIWCGVVEPHDGVDTEGECPTCRKPVPAQSVSSRAELPVRAITGVGWSDGAPGCRDCGHNFSPESSPHLDRCWECAERADTGGVL